MSAHENSDMVLLRSTGPDFCAGRIRDDSVGPPSPEAFIVAAQNMTQYLVVIDLLKMLRYR